MRRGALGLMSLTASLFVGLAYGQERVAPEQGGSEGKPSQAIQQDPGARPLIAARAAAAEQRPDAKPEASSQCFIEVQSMRDPAIRLRIYGPYISRKPQEEARDDECDFPPWKCRSFHRCRREEPAPDRRRPDGPRPGPEQLDPNLKLSQEWGEIYVGPRARLTVFKREGGSREILYGKPNSVLKLEPRALEEMDTLQILCD
jgi:hypothetical protein